MEIELVGGRIKPYGLWSSVDGEQHSMWSAQSYWTSEVLCFYTRAAAEFFVWVINERFASRRMRGKL